MELGTSNALAQMEGKVDAARIDKLRRLDGWLKLNGAKKNKIDWCWFNDAGIGVSATADIEVIILTSKMSELADETLLVVPMTLCVNYGVASELFGQYLSPTTRDDKAILIYLFLIHHKYNNPNSFWKPYIDILPEEYSTPIFWSAEELELLGGSPMFEYTLRTRDKLRGKYHQFVTPLTQKHPDVFPPHIYTFQNFLWGHATLWTRCFGLSTHEKDTVKASMVPLADMFNHSAVTKHSILSDEELFRFKTHQPYKKGSQVFNHYGRKNNSVLLFHYGFVVEPNPFKNARPFKVTMGLNAFDTDMDRKLELLVKKELDMQFEIGSDVELLRKVLGVMRICALNSFELYFYDENAPLDMVIGIRNEMCAFQKLRELVLKLRSNFTSSIEEDTTLLQKKDLSYRNRCAIVYRMELKESLEQVLKNLNDAEVDFCSSTRWRPLRNAFELTKRNPTDDVATDLQLWYQKRFALADCVELRRSKSDPYANYFAVIKPLELCQSFPLLRIEDRDLILTTDAARDSEMGQRVLSQNFVLDDETLLILYTMYQKQLLLSKPTENCSDVERLYQTFFRTVPREFTTPLQYTDTELAYLKGLPIYDDVLEKKAQLKKTFDSLFPQLYTSCGECFSPDVFTFEAYVWSFTLLQQCGTPMIVQRKLRLVLVPLYRVFAYHPHYQISRSYDNEKRVLELRYSNAAETGSVLLDNYGALNNYHLLLRWGFVKKENPYDTVSFSLAAAADKETADALTKRKFHLLEQENLTFSHELRKDSLSQRLLYTIRICMLTEEELDNFGKKRKEKQKVRFEYSPSNLSRRNEEESLSTLQKIIQQMLDDCEQNAGGTVWDDRDLLASGSLVSERARDAVLYRSLQKELLQRNIRHVIDLQSDLKRDT